LTNFCWEAARSGSRTTVLTGINLMECPVCGVVFDMHDLGAALGEHMHDGPEMPTIICPVPDLEG
jgi:hypothetical protein